MRVSDSARFERTQFHLQRTGDAVDRAIEQLSSGRRISRLSDDPGSAVTADRLTAEASAIDTYTRAADNARAWLGTQDAALQNGLSLVARAREIAIAAASTQSSTNRDALATEFESIRDQLVSVANTTFDGRAVFGGFAASAVDASGPTVTLVGDGGQVQRRLSASTVIAVNTSAADAFGFADGDDIFTVLDDLATATRAGDTATIGTAGLERLQQRHDALSRAIGAVGSRVNTVDHAELDGANRREELLAYRSQLVDVDIAEAAVELTSAETAYEAVLAATARLQRNSLLDYL